MNGAGNKVGIETDPVSSSQEHGCLKLQHSYQFRGESWSQINTRLIVSLGLILTRFHVCSECVAGEKVSEEEL